MSTTSLRKKRFIGVQEIVKSMFYYYEARKMLNRHISGLISNSNIWLIMTCIVVIFLIIDLIITRLPFYDLRSQESFQISLFFGVEVFVCSVSQVTYLGIIKKKYRIYPNHLKKFADTIFSTVSLIQYFIIALLVTNLIELGILKEYDTITLRISVLSSMIVSMGLSSLLATRFLSWTRHKRDYVVIAYSIAAILLALNSMFVAMFMLIELQNKPNTIDLSREAVTMTQVVNYDIKKYQSNLAVLSFLTLWIASTFLLRHYKRKWGPVKFYTIIFIPLIYYLGFLQLIVSDILVPFKMLNTFQLYTFNVINSNLTKPVGGTLFGIAFLLVGRGVTDKNIRDYMRLSAIGLILISVSNQDAGLYLLSYPPFGLPTITFAGISSYLLFIGIYYTSISVSVNTELRKSINESLKKEFKFVYDIGRYQLEHDIENRIKVITNTVAKELEENSGIEVLSESENMQEYIRAVIEEKEKMLGGNTASVKIYPIDCMPCGRTWDEWVQLWWKWCYSEAMEKSPPSDDSGELCSKGQIYEKVWFLAGTYGGPPLERACNVPKGRSIFFPLLNDLISFTTDPHLKTEDELRLYAKRDLDETSSLFLTIDDVQVGDLKTMAKYRISSSMFEILLPPKGSNSSPVRTRAVSDGYWVFLEPLQVGDHEIKFGGEKLEYDQIQRSIQREEIPKFRVSITYKIRVV